eukprot:TRINITY_DN1623_c0_g1_i1.p1 TRINITY_DN1623_c0_g1~~TRINITY_DN1623_c0_g1_i1.p1  ORF type:complete len:732 (-),score=257.03 TRINITY_DN1623_c0_g1_i1:213-2408(-)
MAKKRKASEDNGVAPSDPAATALKKKRKGKGQKKEDLASDEKGLQLKLADDNEEAPSTLTISEKYAKRYNEKKDRAELARAKKVLEDEASHSSDSSLSEDDHATLLTEQVNTKIFDTLEKIKKKDPSIYDKKSIFFNDKDFTASAKGGGADSSAKKGMKYKDFIRDTLMKEGADALVKEEEELERKAKEMKRLKTPNEEQRDLKASIVSAAHDGDDSEDDLFTLKEKTVDDLKREAEEFEQFKFHDDKKNASANGEEIMSRYWKADEDLDDNEQFLRDFILGKGWLDTGSLQAEGSKSRHGGGGNAGGEDVPNFLPEEMASEEEEEQLEKEEDFEREYNFRFEVEEGTKVQGHERFPESSVRDRNDKRKRQRAAKADRKESDKIRRVEELKRLKNLKKQEIMRRLQQIQEVTGNQESALGAIDLDKEFDPTDHDKEMEGLLGEDYDEQEEDLDEETLTKAPEGLEKDLDTSSAVQALGVHAQGEDGEAEDAEDEEEVDNETWWLCDGCGKGIVAGKRRFDCSMCENFTLCVKCFRVRSHPHKFIRRRVPENCMPPADLENLGNNDESDPAVSSTADAGAEALDDYFQLDYEDIIGGDLPTRFKYRSVEKNTYGMSAKDILEKSDRELNQVMPLKKLRPFHGQGGGDDEEEGRRYRGGRAKGEGKDDKGKGKGKGGKKGKGGGKGSKSEKEGLSATRLGAYNLEADRRKEKKRLQKEKEAQKQNRPEGLPLD